MKQKHIRVTITQDRKWNTHVENIVQKAAKRIYLLKQYLNELM